MRTISEVAELTGVSVRTLQYYDEIGVFKPTTTTDAGYRLYDDEGLVKLQQILFFKELDFQLKDIKEMMENPLFDKIKAFKKQKQLIRAKRDRLNGLLELLEKLERGEVCMSFKEFDLSEYVQVLEQFKTEQTEEVIKHWGSVAQFDEFINKVKADEEEIAKLAIKQYGSIEKYTAAMKDSMNHFSETMEKTENFKPKVDDFIEKSKLLRDQLVEDITKDVTSKEIQDKVKAWINLANEVDINVDNGENYWNMISDTYCHNPTLIESIDKSCGDGASEFIGRALYFYFNQQEM